MSKRSLLLFASVLVPWLVSCSWLQADVYLVQIEVPLRVPPQKGFQSRAHLAAETLDPRFLSGRFALTKEGKQHLRKTSDPFPGETNRVVIYTCPEVLNRTHAGNSRVIIDVSRQRVYLEADGLMALETQVSTARTGKYTPFGAFSMSERVRYGKVSSLYGVSMPYWMRLGDSEFGVHAGYLPGYPASAGCIRLPLEAARIVYEKTAQGTPVTITRDYAGPKVPASQLIDPRAKDPAGQVLNPVPATGGRPAPNGPSTPLRARKLAPARKIPEPPPSQYPVDELGQTFRRVRL